MSLKEATICPEEVLSFKSKLAQLEMILPRQRQHEACPKDIGVFVVQSHDNTELEEKSAVSAVMSMAIGILNRVGN